MKLDEFTSSMLARAVEMYLHVAYPHGLIPPHVLEMGRVDPSAPLQAELARATVEKREVPGRPGFVDKYRWRLGNERYPHMKLGIERCSEADDFVFAVDTHDRDFPLGSPLLKSAEFREVLRYNQSIKHTIESQWQKVGLPTFSGHITTYIRQHQAAAEDHRKTILIVDDDPAICELEQALLEEAGYRVVTAPGGPQALAGLPGLRITDDGRLRLVQDEPFFLGVERVMAAHAADDASVAAMTRETAAGFEPSRWAARWACVAAWTSSIPAAR
jgi:hypothetical protein